MASSAGGVSWSRAASPMAAALPEVAPLSTIKAPESSAKGATARLKIDRTFGWRAASKLPSRIMIELDFRLTLDAAVPGVSRACSSIGGFIVYSFAWWIQYHTRAGRLPPAGYRRLTDDRRRSSVLRYCAPSPGGRPGQVRRYGTSSPMYSFHSASDRLRLARMQGRRDACFSLVRWPFTAAHRRSVLSLLAEAN